MVDNAFDSVFGKSEPSETAGIATGNPAGSQSFDDVFGKDQPQTSPAMLEQQLQKNPDEVAKKRKLQERFDAPPETVDRLADQLEAEARAQDFANTVQNAPATREFFEEDPERVALAADSIEDLSLIERWAAASSSGYSKGAMQTQFLLDVYAGLQAGAQFDPAALKAAQESIERLNKSPEGEFSGFLSAAATFVGQQVQTVASNLPEFAINVGGGAVIGAATGAAVGAPTGPGAGATAAVGAARGAAAGLAAFYTSTSFKMNFAENFVNMVTAGHDPQTAYWTSIVSGTINSLIDTAGASVVAKPFVDIGRDRLKKLLGETVVQPTIQQAAKRFFVSYVGGVASQVTDETAQEAVNVALQKVAESWADADVTKLTDDEIKERLTSTIVETFKGMVLLAPVGPGARAINDMARASDRAKVSKEQADRLSKLIQGSKLFERDPDTATEHAQTVIEAAAQHGFYVTADALDAAARTPLAETDPLNRGRVSDLITALGIDREELERARALGGDVKLSSKQYAKVLASPSYPALADHIRRGEDGMTAAEAKEFDDAGIQAEIAALQKPLPEDVGGQPVEQADGATAGGDQANREGGERQGTEAAGRGTVSVDFPLATDKETFAPAGETPLKNTDRLPGLPEGSPSPVPDAVAAAELYAEQSGMPFKRQPEYVIADPGRGARIAQAYEEMKHDPSDPQVQAAYQALIEETLAQYQIIKQMNLNIEVIPKGMKDPYGGSSRAAIEDMAKGHLWVYPTDAGFGSQDNIQTDHPLLAKTNEFIGDHQLLANDVFRIVHDVFGHAKEGFQFGANGEENAWQAHSLMYSPLAARAMTTETRGQNSWVNFGPHGESNRARPSQTIYAAQKAGLLPEWAATEGRSGDPPKLAPKQEQAVQLAEAELGLNAMFKTAAEAGMTPEQYRGYLIAVGQAAEAGRKRKEERALKRRLKENSESWKKEYETELTAQTEALGSEPVYAAFDGIQRERLNREQVLAALGGDEAQLAKLPKQKGGRNIYTDKGEAGGLDLDTYAQLHDFAAGDVMLFQMMDRPPKSVEAARLAQKEMQAKHGHILSERQEIDEAIEALHTDQQGALLAMELNQLREAQGQGRLKRSLLRQAARNTIQTMHLTGISPRQFFSTEQRLGRLAGKLLRKGDRATAAKAKFQQVLNFEMAKEAFKIQAQVEKDRRWLLKFYRHRSKWTDLPGDYLDHIRILLDNFNIETRATVSRGQEIEAWLKAKKAIGEEIEIPARFLAPGGIQNYTDMKLEDWQSFVAKIRELHHRGVTERKLMKAQERATIDELAAEVRAQIDTNLSQVATSSLSQTTFKDRVKKYGREGVTLLLNATSMLREIDGFKDFGPAYTNIKGRIDQALSRGYHPGQKGYLFQQKKQSQRIIKLFEAFSLGERKQSHKRFEGPPLASGKTLTRKEALSILLNSGNSENIKAMLDSKELTEQDLQNIWSAAPKKYWDFAQSVWDYLDGFWPDIEAAAMRRNGFAPEKVQAQARVTPHGVYRGGYYPLRYDNRRSGIPNSESIEEQRQRMRFGNFIGSHTAHGHMEERVGSGGRKLLYDPFVLNAHVDQVIYDLEVGDALRDAYRILHHRGVKEGLAAKGRNERFEGLELWLGDVTMGEMRLGGAVEESLRWLRTGYTVSKLAWNFSTIALQPLGLIQSGVQIGHGRMAKALAGVIGNGLTGNFKVFEMVANETQFMAARWETWNRDIIDAQRQLSDSVLARYTPGKSAEVVQRTLFWGLKKAQMIVDTITWLAAHQKGLDDFKGDSQKAKDYADMMVARSQASGIFAERTALERGSASERVRQSELTRAFTVLASYFMAKTNVAFERTKKTNFKSPVQVLMWAGDMAALYTVEAALAALIRGQWPDDEDEEDVGTFLLSETANAVLAGVPIFREFASEAKGFEGGGIVASVASQVGAFLKQAEQGEADDALRKQSINLLGILLRAPSSQVNKTLDAFSRADEGYEVDFWDFIFGPPRD